MAFAAHRTARMAVLVIACLALVSTSFAANHYLRKGAGGSNNGSDWNNAWNECSSIQWGTIAPGDTLWIAGGTYTSELAVGGSGTATSRIMIKRVRTTDSTPAAAAGWSSSYDSQVIVSTGNAGMTWNSPGVGNYITIDGQVDSGIRLICPVGGSASVNIGVSGIHDVSWLNIDMAGPNGSTPVTHTSNDTALKIMSWNGASWNTYNNFLVSRCRLHGTVNIIQLFGVQNITVEYSKLYDNDAANSSTFHPNLVEYAGGTGNTIWRYNEIWNWTAEGFMIYQGNGGPITVYGNVWHDATSGYPRIFQPFDNAQGPAYFYNNTVYNVYSVWAGGVNGGSLASGSQSANNIYWKINGFIGSEPAGADYEYGDVSLGEAHSVSGAGQTPFANVAGADFHIGATVSSSLPRNKAVNLGSPYNFDKDGNQRGADGSWDIGAYEYSTGGTSNTNVAPTVSAVTQNAADVDLSVAGVQVLEGTVVQYAGSASDSNGDALTWQWLYSVNGGASVVYQSGSGSVTPVTFTYPAGSGGSTYVWTLSVSDGQLTTQSQLSTGVESPPVAPGSLTFQAPSGTLTAPFAVTGNYISQTVETGVTAGGRAAYAFTITNAGSYVIQGLVNAPTTSQNSFYVNIDAEPQDPAMIWQIPITSGFQNEIVNWQGAGTFDNPQFVPKIFVLPTGAHTLIIRGREAGTQLQQISLLKLPSPPQNLRILAGQ